MVKKLFLSLTALLVVIVLTVASIFWYQSLQSERNLAFKAVSPQGKLPDDVIPRYYRLALTIDPDEGEMGGEVNINLELKTDLISELSQNRWDKTFMLNKSELLFKRCN